MTWKYIIAFVVFPQAFVFAQPGYIENKIRGEACLRGSSTYPFTSKYNDCIIWSENSSGREYVIYNSIENIYFAGTNDPANPAVIDSVQTLFMLPIHNIFTYKNYCYASDHVNNTTICDLSFLPDSVVYVNTITTPNFKNVSIISDKVFFANGKNIIVTDLSDPVNPVVVDSLSEDVPRLDTVQALSIQNDTLYATCGFDGLFRLRYDMGLKKFFIIDSIPNKTGPSYQRRHYLFNNILVRTPSAYAMGEDIFLRNAAGGYEYSNTSVFFPFNTAKNFNCFNSRNIISYSNGAVFLYDMEVPSTPREAGSFSMYSGNQESAFVKCFANKKGTAIIAVNSTDGIFILDPTEALKIPVKPPDNYSLSVFPNPASDNLHVSVKRDLPAELTILSVDGSTLLIKNYNSSILDDMNVKSFPAGVYILKIQGGEGTLVVKIVIQH